MPLLLDHVFLLLAIVLLGEALGRVSIKGLSLGTPAILFVALAFGHFGYTLPKDFQTLGLVLFIYAVGLQAGPGFASSFRTDGLRLTLGALGMVAVGAVTAGLLGWGMHLDAATTAGLYAGALTSTPGLAVAVEATGRGEASTAYGLAYVFGVLGVVLVVRLLPRLLKVDIAEEENALRQEELEASPPLTYRHLEVTNPNVFGRRVDALHLREIAPVTITRLLRRDAAEPLLVAGDTVLADGDRIRVVGREGDLEKVSLLLGQPVEGTIEFGRTLERRRVVVSRREVVGATLDGLNLRDVFNVQVSRLVRNGIELPVSPRTRLHLGDVLHVVGDDRALSNVGRLLGNDLRETFTVPLLSIFVGLTVGFLLGQVPLALPWIGRFTLGTTGGVLVAGLVLGRLHTTGPFIWELPATANSFIRDLGLVLFLATVGTSAGTTFLDTLGGRGGPLVLAGMVVTLVPLIVAVPVLRWAVGLRFLRMLGVMTGGMTSTPGLAATTSISDSHHAAAAYATVYPVALVGMILGTRILAMLLGG